MDELELTREIDEGPGGARIGAFFDLDRTLIAGFSAIAFVRDGIAQGRIGITDFAELVAAATSFQLGMIGFSGFLAGTGRTLRGMSEDQLREAGERIFRERIATEVYPEARALVHAHLRKGHTVAIVSSATPYQVDPVARDIGIPHVLATRMEVVEGRLTGDMVRPACYGDGKALYAAQLAEREGVALEDSYFYTDSHEDLPLLDVVGKPRPTNPDAKLAEIAAKRGWPARRFTSRGTPTWDEVARTGLALASLGPSFALGVPAAALSGSWQKAINLAASTWGELGSALAGLEVRVEGEEHLWSNRPAVFIFNHQSGLDMLVLCKLLRRDFVGIAKQEVKNNPIFGPLFSLANTVFVDRFHHEKAIQALRPAVEALRKGLSIAIAPEGTRSPTPHPGRFKKGAFHIAMQAGVPIVPIVLKNTIDALPKHALIVRPSTIDVVVLPPIHAERWQRANLDREIEAVRQMYLDVLER